MSMENHNIKPRIFKLLSVSTQLSSGGPGFVWVEEMTTNNEEYGDYKINKIDFDFNLSEAEFDWSKEGNIIIAKDLYWKTIKNSATYLAEIKDHGHEDQIVGKDYITVGILKSEDDIKVISENQIDMFLGGFNAMALNKPYTFYMELCLDGKEENENDGEVQQPESVEQDTPNLEVDITTETEKAKTEATESVEEIIPTTPTEQPHSVDQMLEMLEQDESKNNVAEFDMTTRIEGIEKRLDRDLSSKQLSQIQAMPITVETLKSYYMPQASDTEAMQFLQMCAYQKLNPFIKEIYWIKAGGRAYTVVSKDTFLKKANENPNYIGFKAGIIVRNLDGNLEFREGTFYLDEEELLGGWAEALRRDRNEVVARVRLKDYQPNYYGWEKGTWGKIPGTMIRKVAMVQALREAFPEQLRGLYDASEMDQAGGKK
jgi:phage recombination protein Bet